METLNQAPAELFSNVSPEENIKSQPREKNGTIITLIN